MDNNSGQDTGEGFRIEKKNKLLKRESIMAPMTGKMSGLDNWEINRLGEDSRMSFTQRKRSRSDFDCGVSWG